MNRLVWLTDIHLNFANPGIADDFLEELSRIKPDAVLLTGDIAESPDVAGFLERFEQELDCLVYFVLGNHDYYFDSIYRVRRRIEALCQGRPRLVYLSIRDAVRLTEDTGLVGHDGWADGRLGDYERSLVMMQDFRLIEELSHKEKLERWSVLKSLGDEAAAHIARVLPSALDQHRSVFLLTHVPPLRQACWHEGRISNDQWAPHFTCKAMGDVILQIMRQRPDRRLTVLCGHTHGSGKTWPLPNVRILTGGATYGYPAVAGVFYLDQEAATWSSREAGFSSTTVPRGNV